MFHSARIQLTAWYLLIIMVVSILFSGIIYSGINQELTRLEAFQRLRQNRIEDMFGNRPPQELEHQFNSGLQEIQESRAHLIFTLLIINLGILVVAGGAGYFLAGRTLRPIQEMVDEQKRFISDASHELRTPLTALRSEIEVELRNKNLTFSESKKLLVSNLEEVMHLQMLTDNLLQLSQVKSNRKDFTSLLITDVVELAIKQVTPLAKKKHITIASQVKKERIKGEFGSLIQLFVILLENAIKYSPPKTTIQVSAKKSDHQLEISVADQGMGIEKKDIPYLFDRFFRADKARSTGGYGLGLSIAKKIIDDHKGTISVQSTLKKGTTITMRFPQVKTK